MNIKREPALSFDDVVIEPEYSEVKRGEADVTPKPFKNIIPKIPIISSPMSSVTEEKMIGAMLELEGLGVHHRYCGVEKLISVSKKSFKTNSFYVFPPLYDKDFEHISGNKIPIAVGSIPSHKETIDKLLEIGHRFFCVDVANGTSKNALDTVKYIREKMPDADIMSGNIATVEQAKLCILAGANILRCSVGSGSVCETRIVTGVGVPALQTIIDIYSFINSDQTFLDFKDIILVCDGGIRSSADMVKALAAGASYVILGNLLAGSDESPGEIIEQMCFVPKIDSETKEWDYSETELKKYKKYYGMSSIKALVEENHKDPNYLHPEGIETIVPYSGPAKNTIAKLISGLKQALFYTGSKNLTELRDCTMRVITNNGAIEGTAHAVR